MGLLSYWNRKKKERKGKEKPGIAQALVNQARPEDDDSSDVQKAAASAASGQSPGNYVESGGGYCAKPQIPRITNWGVLPDPSICTEYGIDLRVESSTWYGFRSVKHPGHPGPRGRH